MNLKESFSLTYLPTRVSSNQIVFVMGIVMYSFRRRSFPLQPNSDFLNKLFRIQQNSQRNQNRAPFALQLFRLHGCIIRWRLHICDPRKSRFLSTRPHHITPQKTANWTKTDVKTSKVTFAYHMCWQCGTLLTRIKEVIGFNIGRVNGSCDKGFSWFSLVP
jgi:hypothetical protein